ncbi:glycosyltransferase family 2 protein [Lacticaseibacillus baoqingensis]|uniref:Glycosyltransferase family 2 protein n=1 Tax=Lacticaseibacillus baoqingensis TaxID=2486013 RepID=A0ABW4E7L3_9LACO|nr:glycosyltransferase family 2 protein [Lacticaseibacillus baoqingensis]
MNSVSISFIITTYNREGYVLQAIRSVLNQQFEGNVDILVIDDDPTSQLGVVLDENFGESVRYHRVNKNNGPGLNRHWGFMNSIGQYVVFMDDDDYYTDRDFVNKAIRHFREEDGLAFVGFNANDFYEVSGEVRSGMQLEKNGKISRNLYLMKFTHGISKPKSTFSSVFSRELLTMAGIRTIEMLNDSVIYLRALLVGDAYLDSTVIGNYRIHNSNITKTISEKFIIDNLNEKKTISRLLPFSYVRRSFWLYVQSINTIGYYLSENSHREQTTLLQQWVGEQVFFVKVLIRLSLAKSGLLFTLNGEGGKHH